MRGVPLLLSLVCMGCSSPTPERTPAPPDRTPSALELRRQALEVCADGPTVFGIDVSKWQGDIDWDRVAADGVRYAFIRVSDGLRHVDQKFERNWAEARRVGILRGVYQYFRPTQDPTDQASFVVDSLRDNGGVGELPPVIDVEAHEEREPADIEAAVGEWIEHVQAELNVAPMIYTGFYFWRDHVGGVDTFSHLPLWHPQYTSAPCPRIADAWDDWAFWQYTSSGRVDGIAGNVDLNLFNGDEEALGAPPSPPGGGPAPGPAYKGRPLGQSFALASEPPIELCVGHSLAGHMRVRNDGTQTWGDSVRLAPTPRDVASPLAADSWLSPTRVGAPDAAVAPGEEGRFSFEIFGQAPGLVDQTFGLVAEGVTWFADDGGPPDDYLELVVDVVDCGPSDIDPPTPSGEGEGEGEGDAPNEPATHPDDDGPDDDDPTPLEAPPDEGADADPPQPPPPGAGGDVDSPAGRSGSVSGCALAAPAAGGVWTPRPRR